MSEIERPGPIRHVLGTLWTGVTKVRVAMSNIIFLLLITLVVLAFRDSAPPPLPQKAALLLNPAGTVVVQKSHTEPLAQLFSEQSPQEAETLLSDMIDAILMAKDDPRISALVMELDSLLAIGVSKTDEVAEAIAEFRSSGKPVVAWNDALSQNQYLLASQADEIIIHPMGSVLLEGFANYQWYFADALEKLELNIHIFKAGQFKSLAEPFTRNDMSAGERAISLRWLNGAWDHYTAAIEARRGLEAGTVNNYVNRFADSVAANGGDLAETARGMGLVDQVMSRAQANEYISGVVGAADEDGAYQAVQFEEYLARQRPPVPNLGGNPQVAVIAARGDIRGGDQPAGVIGGDSLGLLIRQAAEDPNVAAIVLRVDSPGGGTFASEIVRRKMIEARRTGKPLVVSMSSIATSGGYWIASAADEIWAMPTTLTGSIGVFLAVPTYESLLDRAGISSDGVGTTDLAGAFRGDRPLMPEVSATYQAAVDHYHGLFIDVIADGRELPRERASALADGSVFLGQRASELGLVDHLGGRRAAIASAARLAGLAEGGYTVVSYEKPLTPREEFLRQLAGNMSRTVGSLEPAWATTFKQWSAPLLRSLSVLNNLDDPSRVYAHCLVCAAP